MGFLERLRKQRQAIQVTRKASRLLDVRTRVFLRKLKSEDADAQMACAVAAKDVMGIDFDPAGLMAIIEMILEIFALLSSIFDW